MKKTVLLLSFVLSLIIVSCKPEPEPEPNGGGQSADTTETVVKKYLVEELVNDDPERIKLAIDWNDDCTQILHVRYGLGYGSVVDYDFKYYGNDSIRVIPTLPPDSYPLWCFLYDSIIIHMRENQVDSICCYALGALADVEHYVYNGDGKLTERNYTSSHDQFRWEGDNVVEYQIMWYNHPVTFDAFTEYIHPQYTLPFYLSSEVALEVRQPLFAPLWKYQPIEPNCIEYVADEDGYLTKMTFVSVNETDTAEYFNTYYYRTPNR